MQLHPSNTSLKGCSFVPLSGFFLVAQTVGCACQSTCGMRLWSQVITLWFSPHEVFEVEAIESLKQGLRPQQPHTNS